MVSFLAISWVTILFACRIAWHDLTEWWKSKPWYVWDWLDDYLARAAPVRAGGVSLRQVASGAGVDRRPEGVRRVKKLLEPLCDLQLITGVGILVAGFSQISTISFYHEQQVMNYWYLTLNSFWAARIDYLHAGEIDLRTWVHRFAVVLSSVLGVSFQVFVNLRETLDTWDSVVGPCYRWADGTSSWPWVAGGTIYSIALALLLAPRTATLLDGWDYWTESIQYNAVSNLVHYHRVLSPPGSTATTPAPRKLPSSGIYIYNHVMRAAWGIWSALVWLLLHFFDLVSYGNGFYPVMMLLYIGINVWNTYDILSLRVLNTDLLPPDENRIGFGQVLPLFLMTSILFNILDVFKDESGREGRK